MGTLAALLPLLGLYIGRYIAHHTSLEVRAGTYYFILLQHALLAALVANLFSLPLLALGAGLSFFALFFFYSFSHPLELIVLLAVPAVLASQTQPLIFLYLIPCGTLAKNYRRFLFFAIAYALLVLFSTLLF